jgi:hypothetical protein
MICALWVSLSLCLSLYIYISPSYCPNTYTTNSLFRSLCFSHTYQCLVLQILSVQQLYRICTLYFDDNYNTRSVSPDVSLVMNYVLPSSCNTWMHTVAQWIWFLAVAIFFILQVISSMRVLMTEDSNNAVSNSFLLDDNSRWGSLQSSICYISGSLMRFLFVLL